MKTIKSGAVPLCRCSFSCLSSPSRVRQKQPNMQRIIWTLQLFQLYICHSNALYAKLSTATETLQPSQTPKRPERLEQRAVPSEMITCGYKNGGPTAMTTVESGSALCRFSTQNGLWGICKSTGDSKCTLAGRCRDQHDCSDGCGTTENLKFRMTSWYYRLVATGQLTNRLIARGSNAAILHT